MHACFDDGETTCGCPRCASCGEFANDDNELLTDDEGTVLCEDCYNP